MATKIIPGTKLHFDGDHSNMPGIFTVKRTQGAMLVVADEDGRETLIYASLLSTPKWSLLSDFVTSKRAAYVNMLASIYGSADCDKAKASLAEFDINHDAWING